MLGSDKILFAEEVEEAAQNVKENVSIDWQKVIDTIVNWCTTTGIRVLISLIVIVVAFKIINFLCKRIYKRLTKKKADATLSKVLVQTARIALKVLVVLALIGYVGIETASITALVASLGVGISLAVQGTLSNFAGGVIIVVMRPFKLGDFITSNGQSGTVEDIKLFYTTIVATDNKVIYIPNGTLANNVIVNASVKDDRRLDIKMSVHYNSDLDLAKKVLLDVCRECDLVYNSPAPFAEIGEYGDSGVEIFVRVWVSRPDYWTVNWYLLKEFKKALDENNIEIPYNQLDVNIVNDKQGA